jgi:hypothetical protein
VFGIGGYAMHVLMPLYVTSVIWLISVSRRTESASVRRPVLVRVALAIAVIALFARLANMFVLDPVCKKCRWGIPYVKLAETLRADGFDGAGTIVVADDELGGNLRPYFPKTRLVLAGRRRFEPDRPAQFGSPIVFAWEATEARSRLESAFAAYPEAVRALADARLLKAPWHHLWKPDGYRTSDWNYLILH